jgi:hypothetical protein
VRQGCRLAPRPDLGMSSGPYGDAVPWQHCHFGTVVLAGHMGPMAAADAGRYSSGSVTEWSIPANPSE